MNPKPFSEVVVEAKTQEPHIKPFVDEARGGKEIEFKEDASQCLHDKKQNNFFMKSISFLGSFVGLMSALGFVVFVAVILDAVRMIETLLQSSSLLDIFYLFALFFLLLSLSLISYKNFLQIKSLKDAKKMQEAFAEQKITPNKEIIPLTLELLTQYEKSKNPKLKQKAELLLETINTTHEYTEIYKDLDEDIIKEIDKEVQTKIKNASLQAALSTAISPLALLDAGIIIYRSILLTKEIALLYGFKPGWIATVVLLKKGALNVFFAGVSELALEYTNEIASTSLISKISLSAGQGVTNGILLARLGFGVMQACRPLSASAKRSSFMKELYVSLKETIMRSEKTPSDK